MMRHFGAIIVLAVSTLIAAGCGAPERDFSKLADEFVYSTLTFSPIAATAAGLPAKGRSVNASTQVMGTVM